MTGTLQRASTNKHDQAVPSREQSVDKQEVEASEAETAVANDNGEWTPPMPISFISNRAEAGHPMAGRTRQVLGERDSEDTSSFKTTSSDPMPKREGERIGSGSVRPSARPKNGSEVLTARYKKVWQGFAVVHNTTHLGL